MTSLVRTAVKRAQISLSCAVIICACFLSASGKITRKVNPTITSSYLYCKTESPAQLSEDWKRQNVLQSLNCGLGLQDIFFPRENLMSLSHLHILFHQEIGLKITIFLIILINILNNFPKIQSGLCTYSYPALQKAT